MKKSLCIILIISIVSSLIFSVSVFAEGETVTLDGITYTSYDTYCAVTDCDYNKSGEVIIPSSVKFGGKDLPVTKIDYSAFYYITNITSVMLPDSVTSIGNYAFMYCENIKSITIPKSVTSIGSCVFCYCSGLESISVSINNEVYHSKDNCLIETETKKLIAGCKNSVIPDDGSVTSIGLCAFYGCTDLTGITIPDSITSIHDFAFADCDNLKKITVPDSINVLGAGAFSGCYALEEIDLSHNVSEFNTDYLPVPGSVFPNSTFMSCHSLKRITIPDSVKSLGEAAFMFCSSLEEVILPDGLTALESIELYDEKYGYEYYGSFLGCSNLKTIYIPSSIKSIGTNTFGDCENLETVYFGGSEEQWENIYIDDYNEPLLNANVVFNYIKTKPGDVNSDSRIDNKDVVALFRYVSGGNAVYNIIYDFNKDGGVNNKDVVELFRFVSR